MIIFFFWKTENQSILLRHWRFSSIYVITHAGVVLRKRSDYFYDAAYLITRFFWQEAAGSEVPTQKYEIYTSFAMLPSSFKLRFEWGLIPILRRLDLGQFSNKKNLFFDMITYSGFSRIKSKFTTSDFSYKSSQFQNITLRISQNLETISYWLIDYFHRF